MSVLVRGMEMPTSCGDCRFCGGIADTDCGPCAWCDVDGKARVADTRQDCPLVPVPQHGRLIDADALAVHKFAGAEHDISIEDGGACYRRGWNDAIEAIMENAETIIGGE